MSKVIDLILHRNKYSTQAMVVLDKMPEFKYHREIINGKTWLLASDGPFRSAYYNDPPSPGFRAFGGREFDIPMDDGQVVKATGQWWDGYPSNDIVEIGISTVEKLGECNVFMHGRMHKPVAENLLANYSNPSNNVHKYKPRHPDFGKHTIVSPWEDANG